MLSVKGMIISILWILIFFVGMSAINSRNMATVLSFKGIRTEFNFLLIIISFWLFGSCVQDTYDIYWYRYAFENRIPHGKEPLFDFVQLFLYDIGVSFDFFRFCWITIIAVLLFRGIKKFTNYPSCVIALSIFSVLPSFVTQLRSAMVCAIVLNIIPLLFTEEKKDRIKYVLIVLLCAQLHIVGYAFLVLIMLKREGRRINKGKYYILVAVLIIFAIGMNGTFGEITSRILSYVPFLGSENNMARISSSIDGVGTPIKSAIFIVFKHVFLYIMADRACLLQLKKQTLEHEKITAIGLIRKMNVFFLLFLPIVIINESFERIFNPLCFIQYAMIFNVNKEKIGLSKRYAVKIRKDYVLIGMTIFMFIVALRSNPDDFVRMMNSLSF